MEKFKMLVDYMVNALDIHEGEAVKRILDNSDDIPFFDYMEMDLDELTEKYVEYYEKEDRDLRRWFK